jgi:hypothetical protein
VEAIILGVLFAFGAVGWGLFLRARWLNKQIGPNIKILTAWLKVHRDLQKASNSVIEIRQMDADSIMFREPTR